MFDARQLDAHEFLIAKSDIENVSRETQYFVQIIMRLENVQPKIVSRETNFFCEAEVLRFIRLVAVCWAGSD